MVFFNILDESVYIKNEILKQKKMEEGHQDKIIPGHHMIV